MYLVYCASYEVKFVFKVSFAFQFEYIKLTLIELELRVIITHQQSYPFSSDFLKCSHVIFTDIKKLHVCMRRMWEL